MRSHSPRFLAALAAMVLLGLLVAACGSSSSSSSSSGGSTAAGEGSSGEGGGESGGASSAKYEQMLQGLWKGTYTLPEGPKIKPPSGKDVWVISLGQSIETAQNASRAMTEAAESLGWKLTVFDGKFESARQLSGLEQAINEGAEGIVLLYIDCGPVKTGLLKAKEQGIPVAGIESKDCEPSLETNAKFVENLGFEEFEEGWGRTQMEWVIAKNEGDAKVIVNEESDLQTTRSQAIGWKDTCAEFPECEIVANASFVGTEFGPPLQQKFEQALNSNPDANGFIATYDAAMTSGGGGAALRASGRLPEIHVMGGEGSKQGIEMIYNESGIDACAGLPTELTGYEAIAVLARAFSGKEPGDGNSGLGFQVCEKGHNLPPKGQIYQAPVDYVKAYEEMWGLK
ncbi:MAG: sugar ABC transporter substrate-binding protein [Actinobacteria bacterium]|nr:sugar ABC transporter substrate-binding protein [Actinomycetota bacterium]